MKHINAQRNWPLNPGQTAILVVDVQGSEVQPELQAREPYYAQSMQQKMLPALTRLVEGARAEGCEIVYTVMEALTRDGRDRSLDYKLSGMLIPKGSPLAEVLPEARRAEDDIVLPKSSSGVFNSTTLAYVLRNMGITNVVVAGLMTDQCIDMAVRDGADLGFYIVCAEDACTTRSRERHDQALKAFGGYCRVQTVDEVLDDITQAGVEGRKRAG